MRFAYADPPYPGQAHKYRNHPDYGGEVDHAALIARLERDYPDGWALSSSGAAMQSVLELCPRDVRVAIWHCTNSAPPGNRPGPWWWCWEPVIVRGGRFGGNAVKNLLACGAPTGFARQSIVGQKPVKFVRWMFGLLGALPDDELDDLFPGSGVVGREWLEYQRSPVLW